MFCTDKMKKELETFPASWILLWSLTWTWEGVLLAVIRHAIIITGRSCSEQRPRFWFHQPKEALQAQRQQRRAAKRIPGINAKSGTKRITRKGTFYNPVFPLQLDYCLGPEADGTVDVTDKTVNIIAKQWSVEVTSQTHAVYSSQVPP